MPWLADTFGLYYNKALFAAAGITAPPKTMTELADDTRKLTAYKPDGSIKVAGFMPYFGGYEMLPEHLVTSWGGQWLTADGKSDTAADPAFAAALTWQKNLVDSIGAAKLKTFAAGMAPEQSAQMAFENGTLAMMVDGEWRTAFIKADGAKVDYATAPMPAADDHPELYGAGYVGGNVIGIPKGSKHPAAAWKLVQFLSTDTAALTDLADAIGNVPTTLASLPSPALTPRPGPALQDVPRRLRQPAHLDHPGLGRRRRLRGELRDLRPEVAGRPGLRPRRGPGGRRQAERRRPGAGAVA